MRLFHNEFGKEFEGIKTTVDMAEFIYCCAKCAGRIEGHPFDMTIDEFCDNVGIEDISNAFIQLAESSGVLLDEPSTDKKNNIV